MAFPLINPYQQFLDDSGAPLADGTVEFQNPDTAAKINTYPTADDADAQTNANPNPLTLNASGTFTGIFLEDGVKYKMILKDSAGSTVDTADDVRCPQYTAPATNHTIKMPAATVLGLFGILPAQKITVQAYTRNASVVEDRTLLASASATTLNNNNVLAALIADLQQRGIIS